MYLDYLKERYTEPDVAPLTLKQTAENFEKIYDILGGKVLKTDCGFVAYKMKGDAVILFDLYIKPENRQTREAWKIHDELINLAREAGKRVAITFSEIAGKNQHLGQAAIKASGFQEAHIIANAQVYVKGI